MTKKNYTILVVVHPVQHDFRCSVPARGHVSRHLIICLSCQAKIKDLDEEGESVWNIDIHIKARRLTAQIKTFALAAIFAQAGGLV